MMLEPQCTQLRRYFTGGEKHGGELDHQLYAAVDAEPGASQPCCGMLRFVTRRERRRDVHDRAALGAIADRGISTAMVQVLAESRPTA